MAEREPVHPTPDEVGAYYDLMGPFYATLWGDNIHVGYWTGPDDTSSNIEAQDRLTDLLIEKVNLTAGQTLLDVGCGVGRPAIRLSRRTGSSVCWLHAPIHGQTVRCCRSLRIGLHGCFLWMTSVMRRVLDAICNK